MDLLTTHNGRYYARPYFLNNFSSFERTYLACENSEYLGKRNIQFSKGQNQIFLDFWKPPVLATVLQGLLINTIINLYSIKCRWYFDLSLPNFLAKRFSFDVAFIIVLKTKVQFHFSRIHGKILELIFDVMSSF